MASACNGLKRGFGSQPEIGVGSRQWKHQILITRPVVSDKGPGPSAMHKRIPTKMESSEASTLFIKRKRVQYVWIGTWADSEREYLSCALVAVWSTFMRCFFQVLWKKLIILVCLVHSLYLVLSQDPPKCAQASLSQNGFYRKGIWVGNIPWQFYQCNAENFLQNLL